MYRPRSPTRHIEGFGRRRVVVVPVEDDVDYLSDVLERFRRDALRRRREFRSIDEVDRGLPLPNEVDLIEFYCKENAKVHHTENYDLLDGKDVSPIYRRGETFYFAIRFKRPVNLMTDKITLQFSFGPKQQIGKGTLIILPVPNNKVFTRDSAHWDACISRQERAILTLQVQIPYTAGVGLWRMKIKSQVAGNEKSVFHECKESIYVLFNPWCKDDPVFLSDSKQRLEYVLNDEGKIFVGSYKQPVGRPWVFGQFADAVLPASVFLLERSGLDYTARGNPVKVVRAISAMVNSNDDRGVLIGNWSGNYDDGTAPWSWTGSSAILEQYLASGGQPVRYGQCWVFSGVCTTVCRALGIPCRSVTNYVSAHDTDDSLTIDKYFDAEGNELSEFNEDSIWNFHVWNDCWMSRSDLPSGYGGWQAIDATPQETSEGAFRAGPASLVAIRRGEINHSYDTPFVFAEVNADIVHWKLDKNNEFGWIKLKTNTYQIGKLVVTKRIGFDDESGHRDMEDISAEYKSKEGSVEERMAVLNAARRGGLTHIYDMPPPGKEDVKFILKDIDKVMIGRPFHVVVEVENNSDEKRTVTSVLSASTVHYTGITARKVKRARGTFTLKPRQKEELGIEVTVDEYLDKLVDYAFLKIYAISTVKETQQTWADEDDFQVEKPTLRIEVEGTPKVHRRFRIRISFTNPLKRRLEDCALTLEGPGLAAPFRIMIPDVEAERNMSHEETLIPIKPGPRKITVIFSSRQLIEVVGSKQVIVQD
ncbi:hemocyte protein-glutamine gamma-glutamyltransferase [Parasteatoda tepidariorum]|uniref:hemocyte protein-glutamine gamma-glutamyltransferase n=1 Tax=Parasteatoda tepidariorum TaxID=114398 RepID=UPI00077F84DC|nr:hemocyte protein-glutamine gamma-glutamyltransferase [Parasteatoda tepidariorum]XP_015904320.1 hemocyte protein-glutamine gamma-glutamyltransferase [Parasteatoda tepidariorum]XP_015904321.1 hemocyte protein-glutamine gamma-glutamyltransferase [Parasteatoda tepidariorum]XP_015904322.1 hemocyte protein-glutamine gamma-glutamyltransferase [Parasteatoda tepidariorum]